MGGNGPVYPAGFFLVFSFLVILSLRPFLSRKVIGFLLDEMRFTLFGMRMQKFFVLGKSKFKSELTLI